MTIGRYRSFTLFSFFIGLVLTFFGCSPPDEAEPGRRLEVAEARRESVERIRSVLDAQTTAWNRGSIGEFMESYARTDSLRFASGGSVWYGWERTYQRYRETYADDKRMGRLTFSNLDIRPLSDRHAVVFGRWLLTRSEGYSNTGGLFTLVFERADGAWRIVHDHTSVDPAFEVQHRDSANTNP